MYDSTTPVTTFDTNCDICGSKLNGHSILKESKMGIFSPIANDEGEILYYAMGKNRYALCKACTQSLYSWIKNRRKKSILKKNTDLSYPITHGPNECGCTEEFLSMAEKRRRETLIDK